MNTVSAPENNHPQNIENDTAQARIMVFLYALSRHIAFVSLICEWINFLKILICFQFFSVVSFDHLVFARLFAIVTLNFTPLNFDLSFEWFEFCSFWSFSLLSHSSCLTFICEYQRPWVHRPIKMAILSFIFCFISNWEAMPYTTHLHIHACHITHIVQHSDTFYFFRGKEISNFCLHPFFFDIFVLNKNWSWCDDRWELWMLPIFRCWISVRDTLFASSMMFKEILRLQAKISSAV